MYEENYPILKERDVYIALLTDNLGSADGVFASDYLMKQLHDVFASGGYTEEMYYADNEENLVKVARPQDTTIALSVVYSIAGGAFTASIPHDSVSFDSTCMTPMTITLLPYFGAADAQQSGYMFVPDGSGAIIQLNSAKYGVTEYVKRVYGRDYAVTDEESPNLDIEQIYLPVFGMRQSNAAGKMQSFLAVIEQGDALAELHANISGKVSAYNTVYSTFHVNQTQKASDQTLGVTLGLRYQEEQATSDLTIQYLFLDGEQSTYTDMAHCYRRYLTDRGELNSVDIHPQVPLFVSTIGAVDAIKTVAGIPVNSQVSLTSYDQNAEMIKTLQSLGIENLVWNTEAWCNNGVRNTPFTGLSVSGTLGGKKDYRELVAFAKENGVTLFAQAKLQTVNVEKLFDGFSRSKQAARNLENATAYESDFSLVTRSYDEENRRMLVSPKAYGDILGKFLKSYQSLGNTGVDLDTLGSRLNGDYFEDDQLDRQEAKQAVIDALKGAKDGWSFAAEGANAYTLQALDFAYNIPTRSSREYIFDECVPFFQTVVHGLIPYAGKPMNLSSEYDVEMLRLIETGTIPAFMWIYEDNSVLKNTDFNFYSVSYQTWTDRAATLYQEVNKALTGVTQASIVGHEYLTDDVVCTAYDNGVKIYVNYGNTDYQTENGVIPAVGYLRVG